MRVILLNYLLSSSSFSVIQLEKDVVRPKNVSLEPLSELEIKSDFALQKSLQRTTMRVETYTERPTISSVKV